MMIAIIIFIALLQCYIFLWKTLPGIKSFRTLFEADAEPVLTDKEIKKSRQKIIKREFTLSGVKEIETDDWEDYIEEIQLPYTKIDVSTKSSVFDTIVCAINRYLKENTNRTSDFSLIKDIVDRNSDAKEEDTRELIPLPLYLGLAGTMLGIALGVGSLVFGGGLDAMFNANQSSVSAKGIAPLLKDVSLAMICSFLGLIFTTWSTFKMRSSKSKVESDKHNFLSWIQANLLPEMPDNMSSVVMKLTGNLTEFNRSFSKNADRLKATLNSITEASAQNARLLEAVNELKQVRVASSNLQLYERLTAATQEIGTLASYLENCSSYLSHVKTLNDKLDDSEERMKAVEEMGQYFVQEKAQVVHVSKLTQDTLGQADEEIRKSTKQFGDNIEKYFNSMQENLQKQAVSMEKVLTEQQQSLTRKVGEMSAVVSELKNMGDVKKVMSKLLTAYQEQNRLLTVAMNQRGQGATPLPIQRPVAKLPKWLNAVIIILTVLIVAAIFLYFAHTFHFFSL